jgi:transposase InsO family protein
MPWKEATKVDERRRMVILASSGLYQKVELAEMFDVSRPTVDLWIDRYREFGEEGLMNRPSTPVRFPHRKSDEVRQRVIDEKKMHDDWGPKKIIDYLRREEPDVRWPSPSTAGDFLDAEGLVRKRRKRRSNPGERKANQIEPTESGEMMTADHKGQFRLGDRSLCYPLTINDPVSRYSYAIDGLDSTSAANAQPVFERVFREHGLPHWIKTDNGCPFCSNAIGGLSKLSVWWIKLGITHVRTHPGCPWQNGAHERMHRTLKASTTRPPGEDMAGQQRLFDEFQHEYNTVRPHESLNGRPPITALKPCSRPYPESIPPVEYPGHFEVRSVRTDGRIKWRGQFHFISEVLVGERVGLEEIDDGICSLSFSSVELTRYDERTGRFV